MAAPLIPAAIRAILWRFGFGRVIYWVVQIATLWPLWKWLFKVGGAGLGFFAATVFWLLPGLWEQFYKVFLSLYVKAMNNVAAPIAHIMTQITGVGVGTGTVQGVISGGGGRGDNETIGAQLAVVFDEIFDVASVAGGYESRNPGVAERNNFNRFMGQSFRMQAGSIAANLFKDRVPFGMAGGLDDIGDRIEKIFGIEDAFEETLEPLMEFLITEGMKKDFNRRIRPTDLTPHDAIGAHIRGWLGDQEFTQIMNNEGYRADIRDVLHWLNAKDLSESDMRDYYQQGLASRDDLLTYFKESGYLPEEAASKAFLIENDRLWKLKGELVNCKEQQFIHGVIDEASFRSFLSMNNYSSQEEDIQVDIAKCRISLGKKPSEKQITGTFNVTNPKASAGGASVMSWNIRNATRVSITDIGEVEPRGEILVYPTETRTYYLDASSDTDQERFSAVVIVPGTVEKKRPTVTFSASPGRVTLGQPVELKWTTSNAESRSIGGIGPIAESGVLIVTPLVTTIYTLRARNSLGETVRQDAVFVTLPDFDLNRDLRPGLSFSITPTVIKTNPPQAEMKWSISRAEEGKITFPDGNSISVGRAGAILINPPESGVYTLTASNLYGESKAQEAAIVETSDDGPPPPPPDTIPPTVTISATPQTVRPGETVFVSWFISGAATGEVLIPNRAIRPVGPTGSDTWQAPTAPGSYEFVVRATNAHGTSQHAASVVVSG